jgi:acyl-CoA synthetase (AMP-forming)/AMP-acid ligase II
MMIVSTTQPHDTREPNKYFPLRMYSPLPLFHGTGLFGGLCYTVGSSSTFCLARKFSSSRFWQDVSESRATRIIYVGELCRYVLTAPPSPYDRNHQCIVATGNGLRGEIWEKFRERFGVPEIREFYRSTEGVAKFDNYGKGTWGAGKLGFAGPLRRWVETDTFIVRTDPLSEEVYRDPKTGFCVKAKLGEPGEAIGRVKDRDLLTEYLGNGSATESKLIRDVFVKGDLYHRMGDMLLHHADGWVQFHDRLGDTFRWKGENVSAGEVRDHIAKLPGVQDAVVYGVKLASYDGQAGAACITLDSEADEAFMGTLFKGLRKTGLPLYAVPRLVRISKE